MLFILNSCILFVYFLEFKKQHQIFKHVHTYVQIGQTWNKQTKEQTNEQTKEQMIKQTNKQSNKWTNKRQTTKPRRHAWHQLLCSKLFINQKPDSCAVWLTSCLVVVVVTMTAEASLMYLLFVVRELATCKSQRQQHLALLPSLSHGEAPNVQTRCAD